MTDLDDIPDLFVPTTEPTVNVSTKRCGRHDWCEHWKFTPDDDLNCPACGTPRYRGGTVVVVSCRRCGQVRDEAARRRNTNNRKRGGAAELTAARIVGGRKVGPLGHPWDVEMPGYARIQVRKYKTPQGLRTIDKELRRIGFGPEMPGYIWIEPGRGGARLIVFDLDAYAERHGIPEEGVA